MVNDALAGLPTFDRFTLRFTTLSPLFTSNPPRNALPLLRVIYTSYPVYEGKGGASASSAKGGERWAIQILPIPYQHRDVLKAKIVEHALPALREWLGAPILECVRRIAKLCWYVPTRDMVQWLEEAESSRP